MVDKTYQLYNSYSEGDGFVFSDWQKITDIVMKFYLEAAAEEEAAGNVKPKITLSPVVEISAKAIMELSYANWKAKATPEIKQASQDEIRMWMQDKNFIAAQMA